MKCSLIISRFNEDLDWLNNHKSFKIIIYNKGEKLNNQNFNNIFNIKNVGRESQTFLYHIVKNYKKLDEVNIFLQGRIDDLCCLIGQRLCSQMHTIEGLCKLAASATPPAGP